VRLCLRRGQLRIVGGQNRGGDGCLPFHFWKVQPSRVVIHVTRHATDAFHPPTQRPFPATFRHHRKIVGCMVVAQPFETFNQGRIEHGVEAH